MLETVRKELGWGKPLPPGAGLGIALTARHIAGGKTSFVITAREDGSIAVDTGSAEPGPGLFTVIQRVLAAELGLDPKRITVERGATDAVPWDPGIGGSKGRCCSDGPPSTARVSCARRSRCRIPDP